MAETFGQELSVKEIETARGSLERLDRQIADANRERENLSAKIRHSEAELKEARNSPDWQALAERYQCRHLGGSRSRYARGLNYRAMMNRLTPEDQAELRTFEE